MSPNRQTAGAPDFVMTITGSNFCVDGRATGTIVNFNGNVHDGATFPATSSPTTSSASTTITAAEIASQGVVPVTITNFGCGVGTSNTLNFTINPPLTLSPTTLPNGAVGSPYNRTVNAAGGTPAYGVPSVTADSGPVPPNTTSPGSVNFSFTPVAQTFYGIQISQSDSGGGAIFPFYFFSIYQPTGIAASQGTPQSATVNTTFATTLQVLVTRPGTSDVINPPPQPIEGAQVTFSAPGSGPSGTFLTPNVVFTDTAGHASVTFRANGQAGAYLVTATVSGSALSTTFSLINTPGAAATITATTGSGQSVIAGNTFPTAMSATVRDAFGNPISGATVTFVAPASGASGTFASSPVVITGATGVATAPAFTANTSVGSYNVTATTPGVNTPASFALTNNPRQPASITVTAGSGQSATINTAFGTALKAIVRDIGGNPVPNVSVVFAQPGSGPSGSFAAPATVLTDAGGVATAPTFTANSVAGSYSVTASTAGVATPASFGLTNNPGAPASITATGGSGQIAIVGFTFQLPLTATVKDVGGNPVTNALVTFGLPGSGAGATFNGVASNIPTNSAGIAISPTLVANGTEGGYNATATVPGVAAAATFGLSNIAGVSITTTQLPSGTVGQPYSAGVGATGGNGQYTFSVVSGSLPPGLTFSSSGSISGIPLAAGLTPVQVQVKDGSGSTASKTLTLKVVAALAITTSSLPTAFQGLGYSVTFSAIGGDPPYTWSAGGGAGASVSDKEHFAVSGLPPGMSFDSFSGTLSGAPTALGDFSFSVQVKDTALRTASKGFTLTSAASSSAPAVKVSQTTLDFDGPTDGETPPPQYVSVVAANLEPLSATIELDSGDPGTPAPPWLKARFVSAITPARLAIFTNQVGLPAGTYKGRVLVKYGTVQTLVVNVNFKINLSPPQLSVAPNYLRFAAISGVGGVLEQALLVRNVGTGGAIDFSASVVSGSAWLTVTPASGKTSVSGGVPLRVLVNPQGLKIGSYLGRIRLASALGGTVDVPVSLFMSPNGPIIGLSAVGVRFDAREGNGLTNSREITVLNVGTGTVNWNAALKIGGQGWASLNPGLGQATPNSSSKLVIAADPKQQKAGAYYALVEITDPQAVNSPQFLVAVLNVRPAGAAPEPDLSPAGLYFTAVAGGPNPAPQSLTVYGGGDTTTPFQSAASSDDGAAWISIDKTSGAASTQSPGQILVTVNSANLKAGVYTGDVSVSFSSQTIRTANVTLIVLPQGAVLSSTAAVDKERSASNCTPSKLAITSTSLVNAFSSPAGWPTPLSVRVTDDCANAAANAQVVATFSNGDPPIALSLTNPGAAQYSGTWAPGRTASQMTVTISGLSQGLSSATAKLTGTIGGNTTPSLAANGTVNNVTGTAGAAVAPGTVVQIFGGGLAPAAAQPGVIPLPTTFNDTSVLIGPFAAPVYFLSGGQINAQIPTELQTDRQYPILVNSGGAFTLPDTITITPASPGLLNMAEHTDFSLITPSSPASVGESIILYLVGMGATSPQVASGAASPGGPPASANLQPVVTIGGSTASVSFAGLTPGLVGLYQINAEVPAGVSGDVSVTVTQNDTESNTVTIPVR